MPHDLITLENPPGLAPIDPARKLHIGHFAFMRDLVQEADTKAAWERFLQIEGAHSDARIVRKTIHWIRDAFAAAARREHKFGTARYRTSYESPSLMGLLSMVEAGLAVTPLARCVVPAHFAFLGHAQGLPEIAALEVVLARSAKSKQPPCNFLAEKIVSELRRWQHSGTSSRQLQIAPIVRT
jgi:DNA-binding transcriptional LysR family regulator